MTKPAGYMTPVEGAYGSKVLVHPINLTGHRPAYARSGIECGTGPLPDGHRLSTPYGKTSPADSSPFVLPIRNPRPVKRSTSIRDDVVSELLGTSSQARHADGRHRVR